MSVTVYPKGTTIYKPKKCYNGYTLFPLESVRLINMNGKIVHKWQMDSSKIKARILLRAKLLESGHVIILRGGMTAKDGGVQEYDWNGQLVWEYPLPSGYRGPHHDICRKVNGNTLLICGEEVPKKYREKAKNPRRRDMLYSDAILEVTPDKRIVWEWHEYEHLDMNHYNKIITSPDWGIGFYNTLIDWTHTNTVQALPENKWYDKGDKRFKPGNVLISLRQLDLVLIVDRDTKRIVWKYTGDWKGGLSGQHESHMIKKGIPGEGNILIFDNGTTPYKDGIHAGCSFVLEVNPVTKKIVWKYENGENFHSNFTSSAQRLANGNTLMNETAGGRIFEIAPGGEIVWEYVHLEEKIKPYVTEWKGKSTRAYRYPYEYCSQTKALEKPREISVIPPQDMRISPARILFE